MPNHRPRLPKGLSPDQQEAESWPAFTDLLSAFVLVIFFGLLFFIIHFRKAESKVRLYGKELTQKEQKLNSYGKTLVQQEQQLRKLKTEILDQRERLLTERKSNQKLLEDLRATEQQLRKTAVDKKALERMLRRLKRERMAIETARNKAEQARRKCQDKVEAYVGVRRRIIKRIFGGLRKTIKTPNLLQLDAKGGSIVLGAKVLFQAGRDQLQTTGKTNLKKIWEQIHEVLKLPINRPYIAGIVLEGYTSSEGNKQLNWQLSTRRSLAALQFLQEHGADYWSERGLLAAAGYGPTRLIRDGAGQERKAASRRIEIRILFKDREQLEKLMKQFKQGGK